MTDLGWVADAAGDCAQDDALHFGGAGGVRWQ
jgi:hypothetical protein